MSAPQFTPGPWEINGSDHGFVIATEGHSLAAVWPESLRGRKFDAKANAFLIAAAPELYEALKWALENIQGMIDEDDIPSFVIRDQARAALAKARGELV